MSEERKPMSLEELTAAVLDLPPTQRAALIEKVEDTLYPTDEIEPAVLEKACRELAEMKSGRVKGIPMENLLDELDRSAVAELASAAMHIPADDRAELVDRVLASIAGEERYDPAWVAEMNRRIDEIEAGTAKTLSEEEFFARLTARRHARQVQ